MPQINLLKQQKRTTDDIWQTVTSVSVKVLVVVLVGVVIYYGYLIYANHNKAGEISTLTVKIQSEQKELASLGGRDELFTRQQQLTQLLSLVSSHPYWSGLLPALAKVT